ncbi:MAG: hypothetical protein AAF614_25255 [Chloroflexota bacterium]
MSGEQVTKANLDETSGVKQVGGDLVGRDKYTLGSVSGSYNAIGPGARAEINHYTEIIVKLDSIEDLPPAPGEAPYKGLAYFTEKDADIYYGREVLSQQIATQLGQQSFLTLIGASGSGKSSLLRAGIVPLLRQQNWRIHIMTPGAQPLDALTNTLSRDVASLDFAPKLKGLLLQKTETLYLVGTKLASQANEPHLLLVVDQFEELFTQCRDEQERRAFVENLITAVHKQGVITILISLRADFYARCAQYEGLRQFVSQQQEFIGPLKQEALVRVIAEPAKRGGWQFVEGLVEQILEDIGQEPGRLPLLSHALRETWERRRGTVMTLAGYRAVGGVEGAIAKTAENSLQQLERQDKTFVAVAKSIFLSLTELGEGSEDTRRIASRQELEENNAERPLDDVLQRLVAARLITTGDGQVEVAHEALIRRWPRLHSWLADSREQLRFQRQLAQDAEEWEALDKDPGMLYRGARLEQALEWSKANAIHFVGLSARFLVASRQEAEREAREKEAQRQRELANERALAREQRERAEEAETATKRQKRLAKFAYGILLIAVIAAIFAGIFGIQARSESIRANARALVGQGQAVFEEDPLLGLALILEGLALANDDDKQDILGDSRERIFRQGRIRSWGSGTTREIQLSPDGNWLLLNRIGANAELYSLADRFNEATMLAGEIGMKTSTWPRDKIGLATFSPDGEWLLLDYGDNVRDELRGRASNFQTPIRLNGEVASGVFSPNGKWLFLDYEDAKDEILDTNSGIPIPLDTDVSSGKFFGTSEFSPDSKWLLLMGDGVVSGLYETGDGFQSALSLGDNPSTAAFSPGSQWLTVTDQSGMVELRSAASNFADSMPLARNLERLEFSLDDKWLLLQDQESNVEFRDAASQFAIARMLDGKLGPHRPSSFPYGLQFSPDSQWLVLNYVNDASSELRNAASGFTNPLSLDGIAHRWEFSLNNEWLVILYGSSGKLYATASDSIAPIALPGLIIGHQFSPDSRWLVLNYGGAYGELSQVDSYFTSSVTSVSLNGDLETLEFSSDSKWLWVKYHDDSSRVWSLNGTTEQLASLGLNVEQALFMPETDLLAIRHSNGEAYLLDLAWLRAMHGSGVLDVTNLDDEGIQTLIALACQHPLQQGLSPRSQEKLIEIMMQVNSSTDLQGCSASS